MKTFPVKFPPSSLLLRSRFTPLFAIVSAGFIACGGGGDGDAEDLATVVASAAADGDPATIVDSLEADIVDVPDDPSPSLPELRIAAAAPRTAAAASSEPSKTGMGTPLLSQSGLSLNKGKSKAFRVRNPKADDVYIMQVTPSSGDVDARAYGYTAAKNAWRMVRAFDKAGKATDETHIYKSDLKAGEDMVFAVVAKEASEFSVKFFRRKDIGLLLPVSAEYTPYTVPISAVMDHSLGEPGKITLFDSTVLKKEYGCLAYVAPSYKACTRDWQNSNDVMAYRSKDGGAILQQINYVAPLKSYAYYDEHTGIDFAVGGAAYAAMGGTVKVTGNSFNEVILEHGHGWTTHYLHMTVEAKYIKNGSVVATGSRIGTIDRVGAGAVHLHVSVKQNGVRKDPFKDDLWRYAP